MKKPADVSTKKLISLAPNNWARWVTGIPDIETGEILNTEFQWISRQSDVVIQAESPQHGKFLILNRLLAEVGKRVRGKGERANKNPFPFNLFPFPLLQKLLLQEV